jgi:hypothetical protein
VSSLIATGATDIPVASPFGFTAGQTITINGGGTSETAVVGSIARFPTPGIVVTAPLQHEYAVGALVSGTGIGLTTALSKTHADGAQVTDNVPTPGAPNRYYTGPH